MRRLLLLAAIVLTVPAVAPAADLPPVVVQVKPLGPLLEDIRAGARLIGGPELAKQFDDALKKEFGEQGITGLDLTRPIVGYTFLDFNFEKVEKPENVPFIVAAPITSEEAFFDFVARTSKGAGKAVPVPGKKGVYKLPDAKKEPGADPPKENKSDVMLVRIHQGYAYFTTEKQAAHLDDDKLVTADKLTMAGESAILSAKMHFDRLPASVQKQIAEGIDKAIGEVKNAPFSKDEKVKEISEEAEKKIKQMMTRWLTQVKEAGDATFRVVFDPKSGETGWELALAAKPGTSLAKDLASWKPSTNRFADLVSKDAAVGALYSIMFVNQEIRDFFALAFEAGSKEAMGEGNTPPFAKPLLKEFADGTVRTIKAGSFDVGAALTGPDKNGHFTAVGGFSFEDPSKLEKELRTLVAEQAPPEVKDLVKFDAGKAGAVSIHQIKLPPGQLPPEAAKLFGESASAAVAFAPKGTYLAFGPDPVAALKGVVGGEPKEARTLEVKINAAKIAKLAAVMGDAEASRKVVELLGDKDDLYSVFFVGVEGGPELRVRIGFNLKLIAGAWMTRTAKSAPGAVPPPKD